MFRANEQDIDYRFDTHGPGYIARGPRTDIGLVILPPGQDFPNHYHKRLEESFFTLEGEVTLYVDGEKHTLKAGDFCRCEPFEMHYFINESHTPWKAIFVKAPFDPNDGVTVSWRPGESVPQVSRGAS